MNTFTKARLRLTIWYSLVLLVITSSLSSLFYFRASWVINHQYQRLEIRLEADETTAFPGGRQGLRNRILKNELEEAKNQILNQLLLINGLIIFLGAAASYLLSGRTLMPIKKSLVAQEQFVADAAHELKTPLTALKTSLEVGLMKKKLNSEVKKILEDNLESVVSLESLTENLLTLAKLEGNQTIETKEVLLEKVIERALQHIKPLAEKKNISFKPDHFKSNLKVRGDENSFVEVLIIILDNAVKYSPSKSTVSILVKSKKEQISVIVSDKGPGISSSDQQKIFRRFYRIDSARTKNESGGYGLGLAVAKKIMEQYGGEISLESQLGQGSSFKLKFTS